MQDTINDNEALCIPILFSGLLSFFRNYIDFVFLLYRVIRLRLSRIVIVNAISKFSLSLSLERELESTQVSGYKQRMQRMQMESVLRISESA